MASPMRTWLLMPVLAVATVGVACEDVAPPSAAQRPAKDACALWERARPDGSCGPPGLPPDMPCRPAEIALEDGRCLPAGVPPTSCAAGFEPEGSGGCKAALPEQACPPGRMATPGETACREVSPCGEGPWGDIPGEATTQFVDQAYSGNDSNGSRAKPWRTIQEGLSAASPDAIVAIAEGRYEEHVYIIAKPVRLWGRCSSRVELAGTGAGAATLDVSGERSAGTEVRGLSLTGAATGILVRQAASVGLHHLWIHDAGGPGVQIRGSRGVVAQGSLIEQNQTVGVLIDGSDAVIEGTVVRATRPDAGALGRGIQVQPDARTARRAALTLRSSVIEENREIGVFAVGSDVTIEGTVVRKTHANAPGAPGFGVDVDADPQTKQRGALTLRASLIEQNQEVGVYVSGSDATIEDTVVRATQADPSDTLGPGISVEDYPEAGERSRLWLRSSLIDQNTQVGVYVVASDATIEGTIVRATQPGAAGYGGRGISCRTNPGTGERGSLVLRSSLVEQNHQNGVYVGGADATIEGTAVRTTAADATGLFGRGIGVEYDPRAGQRAKLTLWASLVEDNRDVGIFIDGSDATIDASEVRGTQPDGAEVSGIGVDVQLHLGTSERGALTLQGSLVADNHHVGVLAVDADVTIEACSIAGTRTSPLGDRFGDGVIVAAAPHGSSATISGTEIVGNARAGLLFFDSAGVVSGVRARGNRFGLVLQGDTRPALAEGNGFDGNLDQSKVVGGDLEVPTAPLPLP